MTNHPTFEISMHEFICLLPSLVLFVVFTAWNKKTSKSKYGITVSCCRSAPPAGGPCTLIKRDSGLVLLWLQPWSCRGAWSGARAQSRTDKPRRMTSGPVQAGRGPLHVSTSARLTAFRAKSTRGTELCCGDLRRPQPAVMPRCSGRPPLPVRFSAAGILCALALCVTPVAPHPQCLDFKPPFRPLRELQFCVMYKDFGCCDYQKDQELMAKFNRIVDNFDYHGYAGCAGYVMELLCQVCTHGQRSRVCPSRTERLTALSTRHSYINRAGGTETENCVQKFHCETYEDRQLIGTLTSDCYNKTGKRDK